MPPPMRTIGSAPAHTHTHTHTRTHTHIHTHTHTHINCSAKISAKIELIHFSVLPKRDLNHPAESSENTAICAKIRKFVRGFEELLLAAILDQ